MKMRIGAEERANARREKAKDQRDMAKDWKKLVEVMVGILLGYFTSRGGRRRKKSRIGCKGEEQTVFVDLSSHSSKDDDIISSESDADGDGGGKEGGGTQRHFAWNITWLNKIDIHYLYFASLFQLNVDQQNCLTIIE